jgi:hypothetical protein
MLGQNKIGPYKTNPNIGWVGYCAVVIQQSQPFIAPKHKKSPTMLMGL